MPGQHRQRQCTICKKWMRSDNLKGHMKTHKDLLDLSEDELEKELKVRHDVQQEKEEKRQQVVETAQNLGLSIPDEVKESKVLDKDGLRSKLEKHHKAYLERVLYGEEISNILSEGKICEESLAKEDKHALDLYRQQRLRLNINEVILRPWQKDAFDLFSKAPDDRTVHWIYDEEGNSGKSWFQNYVEAYFGYNRVFRCDLRIKHKDMCHILRKRSITTVDIFLFNDSRSIKGDEPNMYRILEDIKDGAATTSKYDNQVMKFKTPNIVVVFSNSWPNRRHLSKDRWKMYEPTENGLQMVKKDRAKTKDVSVRFDIPSRRTYYSNTKSIKEIHE